MRNAIFLVLVILVQISACNNSRLDEEAFQTTSSSQKRIQDLVDSFKHEVGVVEESDLKDSIRINFNYRFNDLLSNMFLDSIRVHIDSVYIDSLRINTHFHCNSEISFSSSIIFQKERDSAQEALFTFMKGLQPGSDTLVGFSYLGNHRVRLPTKEQETILHIFAYPIPVWLTVL